MSRGQEVKTDRRLQTALYGSRVLLQFDLFDSAILSFPLHVDRGGTAPEHVDPSEFVESRWRLGSANHRARPVPGEAILHRGYMDCQSVSQVKKGGFAKFISLLLYIIKYYDNIR